MEIFLKVDHVFITIIDNNITIIIFDLVITPENETTTTQIDREIVLSHHIEMTLNIQIHKVKTKK